MPVAKNKALVVGVSKYPGKLNDLPSVANDAKEVSKILSSKHGLLDKENVKTLTNRNATRDKIISAMKATMKCAQSATVVVYFAGHGKVVDGKYYFVPCGAKDGKYESTAIALDELRDIFLSSKSNKKIMILDFCYSGGITARGSSVGSEKARDLEARSLSVVRGNGSVVIAACGADQKAFGDSHGHGHFTGAFLRGLRGEAAVNGEVNILNLFEYIGRNVSGRQRPVLYGVVEGAMTLMIHPKPKKETAKKSAIRSNPRKIKQQSKSWTTGSGRWTLLESLAFEASVKSSQGLFSLAINSSDSRLDAALKRLKPDRYGSNSQIRFVHANDSEKVKVKSLGFESSGRGLKWEIELEPVSTHARHSIPSMSFNGQMFSSSDIIELRAKKILLNEDMNQRDQGVLQFDRTFVMGSKKISCAIKDAMDQFASYSASVRLKLARLHAIAILKEVGIIDNVFELKLRKRSTNEVEVSFIGERETSNGNSESEKINVSGICLV